MKIKDNEHDISLQRKRAILLSLSKNLFDKKPHEGKDFQQLLLNELLLEQWTNTKTSGKMLKRAK